MRIIARFVANSVDLDQTRHSAASDQDLHHLLRLACPNIFRVSRYLFYFQSVSDDPFVIDGLPNWKQLLISFFGLIMFAS